MHLCLRIYAKTHTLRETQRVSDSGDLGKTSYAGFKGSVFALKSFHQTTTPQQRPLAWTCEFVSI